MRYNKFLVIICVIALLWLDLTKWGVPIFSLSVVLGILTNSFYVFASIIAYLLTIYGIYLVNPPTNMLGTITAWLIEAPLKSFIPFLIIMVIKELLMGVVMSKRKQSK